MDLTIYQEMFILDNPLTWRDGRNTNVFGTACHGKVSTTVKALIEDSDEACQLAGRVLFAVLRQHGSVRGGGSLLGDVGSITITKYRTATRRTGDHPWPCGNRLRAASHYHHRAVQDFVQLENSCLPESEADIAKVWAIVTVEGVEGRSGWQGIIGSPFSKIGNGGPNGMIPRYILETGKCAMIPLDQINNVVLLSYLKDDLYSQN